MECGGCSEPVARPFEGRRMTYGVEFLRVFVSRCKGTMNICPFPNNLSKKVEKSAFLKILGQKDDDLREWIGSSDYSGNRNYRGEG